MITAAFAQAQDHLTAIALVLGLPWAACLIGAIVYIVRDAARVKRQNRAWRAPDAPPVIVELQEKRTRLRMRHQSTKRVERGAKAVRTRMMERELGR